MAETPQKLELIQSYFTDFNAQQLERFGALEALYKEWNEKINVVSRKDIDSLYLNHVLHSLSIAAIMHFNDGTEVIDIGTGGGFPGIPLAIFFPNVTFHLVDSIGKKLKVVEAIKHSLNLENLSFQHTRAEEIKNRQFDFVVSRAVTSLGQLWKWSRPLIRRGKNHEFGNGLFCLKGGDLAQEIFESDVKPHVFPVDEIFPEPYFREKFVLYVNR